MSFTANIGTVDSAPENVVAGFNAIVSNVTISVVTSGSFTGQLGVAGSRLSNIELGVSGSGGGTTSQLVTATMNQGFGITQSVSSKDLDQRVAQILAISPTVVGHKQTSQQALSQSISYTQLATGIKSNLIQHVNQTLAITTSVSGYNTTQKVNQTFSPSQSLSLHGTLNKIVSQTFTPSQVVIGRDTTHQEAVDSFLTYVQTVTVAKIKNLSHSLALVQSLSALKEIAKTISQTLSIQQAVSNSLIYNLSVHQTLNLVQGKPINTPLIGQNFLGQPTQQYMYSPPQVVVTISNSRNRFVLLQAAGAVIRLRTPELGDTEDYNGSVILKRSMNNVLYTYVKRAETDLLKYTFYLGRQAALALEDFLANHSSEIITMSNWKGEVWICNIVNNPFEFVASSRYLNESERIDVVLEFSGIKVAG